MKHEKQKKAYRFLQSRIGKTFTVGDLANAASWSDNSASTYLSKHLKGLVERVEGTNRFKVRREFRRFTFDQYIRLADQTRRVFQTYDREQYGGMVTFELLLPLTQESKLRRALDDVGQKVWTLVSQKHSPLGAPSSGDGLSVRKTRLGVQRELVWRAWA